MNRIINVLGNKMFLDNSPVSRKIIRNGRYEPSETKLFIKHIKENDTILDVGAHIGYYTLLAAGTVGIDGNVYAFEPDFENYSLLCENIRINGYKNVNTYHAALLDKDDHLKLFLDETNTGNHKLFKDKISNWITAECIKLDNLLQKIEVNFIKIDTQGSECEVLKGMENLIKYNDKIKMLIEFYPYGLRGMGHDPIELFGILTNYDFRIFNVTKEGLNRVSKFKCFANKFKNGMFTNLFCIKGE